MSLRLAQDHRAALSRAENAEAEADQLRQQSHELAADLRKAEAEVQELRKTLQLCREAANRDLEAKRKAEAEVSTLRASIAELQAEYDASCRRACNYLLEIQRLTYEMEAK